MTNEWKEQTTDFNVWKPTVEQEELKGFLKEVKDSGDFGKQYLIMKSETEEIWTPSHKVLQNRMINAKVGDEVKIVYEGEELPTVKGNNKTKMYKVYLR